MTFKTKKGILSCSGTFHIVYSTTVVVVCFTMHGFSVEPISDVYSFRGAK